MAAFGPPRALCDQPVLGPVLLDVTPGAREVQEVTEGQVGVQGKSARWRGSRSRDNMERALHEGFADLEQIQGRSPPVL